MIARNVLVSGWDATKVADEVIGRLGGDDVQLVIVFADWRIDAQALAPALQRGFGSTPVIGCTTTGVIGAPPNASEPAAVALALVGDWARFGIGVAPEMAKSALARSRDALDRAAEQLGTRPALLDPAKHVAFTLMDGTSGHEEAFCIGSAATAPQIRVVGGGASTELGGRRAFVWANGEALSDAGIVVVLETDRRFEAVTSQHLVATDHKMVVTAGAGRVIDELDGVPAAHRLRELIAQVGGELDESRPSSFSFARFVDGIPYVRSLTRIDGDKLRLASSVEPGHVLRLMRPGNMIERTRADLAAAAERLGGRIEMLLAFSCLGRHWEASARDMVAALADVYADYPTTGFQSFGEQTGMLFVNHTLTALAIGARR